VRLVLLSEEAWAGLHSLIAWAQSDEDELVESGEVEDVAATADAIDSEILGALTLFEPFGLMVIDERPDTSEDAGDDDEIINSQFAFNPPIDEDMLADPVAYLRDVPECQRAVMAAGQTVAEALMAVHGERIKRGQ
jgi:hypothetical protein